ncbi:alpha/beta fold hydrolase [Pseudonocardia sp. WMMC193]|uniref:alpha/beta fold hydrolase n=1 Tax=Pseudonocardia sp. WMMC193 TaxID=2911965 RepID=UPI001F463C43|nr:alpha/beta hydrolase [Pseudonocardia sp. WMMC193]MCF7551180.1 alpha/beta hydrolase [Pseudonocardia sp. WMMC193]
MEIFAWEGRRIAWRRSGSGPPVVLCHGTPWSSHLWEPYAEALSRDFTVHRWDMPGFGRSSKEPGHAVDFGVQSAAFAALLDHWGLDRPHVVAHDVGGVVSLRTHLVEGRDFASLLLVDVVAVPPAGSPFFRLVQEHPDVLARVPPYIHEALVRAYVANASHRGLSDPDPLVEPWLGEEGQAAFYRQIAEFDESFLSDVERRLPVTVPVRVLWGAEDTWIPLATGRRLADLLGTELIEIPAAGHLVQLDAPVALADQLRTWLAEVAR